MLAKWLWRFHYESNSLWQGSLLVNMASILLSGWQKGSKAPIIICGRIFLRSSLHFWGLRFRGKWSVLLGKFYMVTLTMDWLVTKLPLVHFVVSFVGRWRKILITFSGFVILWELCGFFLVTSDMISESLLHLPFREKGCFLWMVGSGVCCSLGFVRKRNNRMFRGLRGTLLMFGPLF